MKQSKVIIGIVALVVVLFFAWKLKQSNDPNNLPETDLFSAGQVAANHGDCPRAIILYQDLLKKDPRHSTALDFMADCQIKISDKAGAIATLERLVLLDPSPRNKDRLANLKAPAAPVATPAPAKQNK